MFFLRYITKTITMTKGKAMSKTQMGAMGWWEEKRKKDTKDGNKRVQKETIQLIVFTQLLNFLVNEKSSPKVDVCMSIYVPTGLGLSSGYPIQFTLIFPTKNTHETESLGDLKSSKGQPIYDGSTNLYYIHRLCGQIYTTKNTACLLLAITEYFIRLCISYHIYILIGGSEWTHHALLPHFDCAYHLLLFPCVYLYYLL